MLLSVVLDNQAILGVIYQPFTGEIFAGTCGNSFLTTTLNPNVTQPIMVRQCERLNNAIVATTYPKSPVKEQQVNLEKILRQAKLDRYGLDCYAYALLACGQIDAVIEFGLEQYDIRAPEALILSAGGIITNLDGSYPLSGGDIIACGDGRVHKEIVDIFSIID